MREIMYNGVVKTIVILTLLAIVGGCDHNPLDKLIDPMGDGALGGEWGIWKIYDDQLNTRGGIMLCPTDEHQSFSETTEDAHRGKRCLKYSWDGTRLWSKEKNELVNWAVAVFMVAPTWQEYGEEKDLSLGKYSRITFWIRGSLSAGAKIRFEGPGEYPKCDYVVLNRLPDDWVRKEISLTGKSDLSHAKEFFKVAFLGGAGTVYIDDITYE